MTRTSERGRRTAVTWTVHCRAHSDPNIGVHVFACGMTKPCRLVCPCGIGDRYLVVDAVRADLRWWRCADVLICATQSDLLAARRATGDALARLPGCTLAVAPFCASGCVLRIGREPILMSGHAPDPALLATYAHLRQFRDRVM
jgi:hypothetical protein